MEKTVLHNTYCTSFFSDGTIGISDGVGYLTTLEEDEVRSMYNSMKKYFEKA